MREDTYTLSNRECDTVIAALRLWQLWQDDTMIVPVPAALELEAIADEHGAGLTNDEIDALIMERLNV